MRRAASASSMIRSRGVSTDSAWRDRSINGRTAATASRTMSASATDVLRKWSRPLLIRETSSKSSMSRTSCAAWRDIVSVTRAAIAGSRSRRFNISIPELIGASGLRSSCASSAMNSSLRRSASRRSSSAFLRLVMSTSVIATPPSPCGAERYGNMRSKYHLSVSASTSRSIGVECFSTRRASSSRRHREACDSALRGACPCRSAARRRSRATAA